MAVEREAKPWNEVVNRVEEFDDIIVQRATDKIAKKISKEKFKDSLAIDVVGISLMEGGTLASPTVLPAPSGTGGDKVYKAGTGYYSYNGNTFEAPVGKDWYLLDNGTTWSLKDMGALPQLKMDEEVSDYIDSLFTISDGVNIYSPTNNITGRYVNQTKVIENGTNTVMGVFPVVGGQQYAVYSPDYKSSAFYIGFRDTNSTATGAVSSLATLSLTADPNVRTFVAPSGANYAFINVKLPSQNFDIINTLIIQQGNTVKKREVSSIMGANLKDIEALRKESLNVIKDLYNPLNNVPNKFVHYQTGNLDSTGSASLISVFPVKEGVTYSIYLTDANPTAIAIGFRATDSTANGSTIGLAIFKDTADPKVKTFIPPTGAKYGIINVKLPNAGFDISTTVKIYEGTGIPASNTVNKIDGNSISDELARGKIETLEKDVSALKIVPSPLKGKKWAVVGDSITHENATANHKYHYYVSQDVGGMTVYNYGVSGAGFWYWHSVADSIFQTDIDIITIFLGTNDWGNQTSGNRKQLGNVLDTGTETTSGCINTCISKLIQKFPTKKIAIITPLPRAENWGLNGADNAYGFNLKDVVDLLHQYAEHYSLPILDLYSGSNLAPWNSDANDYYFKSPTGTVGDGLHPNDNGQKVIANKIRAFLESI